MPARSDTRFPLVRSAGRTLLLLPLAVLLSGCVIAVDADGDDEGDWSNDWREQQERNLDAIADLRLGLSRESIEAEMGRADIVEAFVRDGEEFVVLGYRTQRRHGDGETTRDETTPLTSSVGAKTPSSSPRRRRTPGPDRCASGAGCRTSCWA